MTYTKIIKGKRKLKKDIQWDFEMGSLSSLIKALLSEFHFIEKSDGFYMGNDITKVKIDFSCDTELNLRVSYYNANKDSFICLDKFRVFKETKLYNLVVVFCDLNNNSISADIYSICDNLMLSIRKAWDLSLG
jgi:hypothetical protein